MQKDGRTISLLSAESTSIWNQRHDLESAPRFGVSAKIFEAAGNRLYISGDILQAFGVLEAGGLHNLIRSLQPPMSERAVGAKRSTLDDPMMCTEPEKEMVADSGGINLGSWMFLELPGA
jgi:hypothetical protein